MITSALIAKCRRDCDNPTTVRVEKAGNGLVNVFNLGRYPVVEGSYAITVGTSARTEGGGSSQYQINLDNGDLQINTTPANGIVVKSQHKYAVWRDANWNDAINEGIEQLNARGFFRQVVRQTFNVSAGVRTFSGPSAAVDIYELLYQPASATYKQLPVNWSYQPDANKIVLGGAFSTRTSAARSYLRNMQVYSATSATLDVKDDWIEPVKKYAESRFFRFLAAKIAKEGKASIDEGHFSFTNCRTMANDLENEFIDFARRKKPARPTRDMQYHLAGGGVV